MYHIRLFLLLCLASAAIAHEDSWINQLQLFDPVSKLFCCGTNDCAHTKVKEVAGGYLIEETGEVITKNRVIWKSPDGMWTRCRYLDGPLKNQTRCLIGPPPNS